VTQNVGCPNYRSRYQAKKVGLGSLTELKKKEYSMPKEIKPLKIRALNVFCSLTLLASSGYILFAGFNLIVLGVMATALAGAATPVVIGGDGILEVISGVVEAIFEGIAVVVEGACNAISALFSW
jgi:hypothetical protein